MIYRFCVDFYGFMLTHMRVDMFTHVFDVFMNLVWPVSLAQALFVRLERALRQAKRQSPDEPATFSSIAPTVVVHLSLLAKIVVTHQAL